MIKIGPMQDEKKLIQANINMMKGLYNTVISIILAIMFLVVPDSIFSAENKEKLPVASLNVVGASPGENIYRGEFFTVTVQLKSSDVTKSGPLKVRIYLSMDRDGVDVQHEFDIFHDVFQDKSGSASMVKHESNDFHDVFQDKSGNISVTGRYIMPYTVAPGDSYWVMAEVSPEEKTAKSGENNIKVTVGIVVPCDQLVNEYNTSRCGDHN